MHEGQATLNYSFGDITVKVGVDGKVDRPTQVIDHMLSTVTAVTGIDIVQYGISEAQLGENALQQKCIASVEFGKIKVTTEIDFNLKQHVSKRTLNSIVFGAILPKVWQTAGIYFGDNQPMTTPAAPLQQKSHREVLNNIDEALLGSSPFGMDLEGSQQDTQRQRQLATR